MFQVCYKKLPINVIAEEIESCSGTQFDSKVVKAFLSLYLEGAFVIFFTTINHFYTSKTRRVMYYYSVGFLYSQKYFQEPL
jgi:hypothetical protein